jgi:CobQ-like glutamine amidotransferase family enzyme
VHPHDDVPTNADIYLIGGGEDGPQSAALEMLSKDGGLNKAVNNGATVLAVCAGFQLIGGTLPNQAGVKVDGLGLVDAQTIYTDAPRSVGEIVIEFHGDIQQRVMTGFENHQGLTQLGSGMTPLGKVIRGVGNGLASDTESHPEGVQFDKVFGTYLHGPVLARNPQFADLVLESAAGPLATYFDDFAESLAAERRHTLLK